MHISLKQGVGLFLHLFFLGNFVAGSLEYVFLPARKNPIPGPLTMLVIGVISVGLVLLQVCRES
ncbi:hypothetical protein GF339_11290 [candidate division KSB3 bacterium]|uniref:Uncharacterized protein n=1 Tax=candidate division KSB3 bacterium TaxID=2044937 RepID=A0A9D5JWC6_9BACT|nr:hypothetical protein [candidate division KSB3 bacterium]MBD3325161.1 hypothetical protein [candidate division KSB3 bacterium]